MKAADRQQSAYAVGKSQQSHGNGNDRFVRNIESKRDERERVLLYLYVSISNVMFNHLRKYSLQAELQLRHEYLLTSNMMQI